LHTSTPPTGTGATADILYAGGLTIGGLDHFGARYYDPTTATWTQPDPINHISSLAQANHYTYASGNPVSRADPSGLFSIGIDFDVEVGPIHGTLGVSLDSKGRVGTSIGGGGGAGGSAGATLNYSSSDLKEGGSVEGGGCVGVVSVCAQGDSSGSSGLGIGVGDSASISYKHTFVIGG
jgi:RHS repeat-associated protein